MPVTTSSTPPTAGLAAPAAARQLEATLWQLHAKGDQQAALAACKQLNQQYPQYASGWHSTSQLASKLNQPRAALAAIMRALQLAPEHAGYLLQQASCLLSAGQFEAARTRVLKLQQTELDTAYQHATLALLLSRLDYQQEALAHYQRAIRLEPEQAEHYYNLATVHRFLGNTEAADSAVAQALKLNPADVDAHKLRADLRRCTPEHNHLDALRAALARTALSPRQQVTLNYALAKELEDLQHWSESFAALTEGAHQRRRLMHYELRSDLDTMAQIAEVYNANLLHHSAPGGPSREPFFIIGMPRTGTTLVERVLGSHSQVHSAGELNNFALQMVQAINQTASARDKRTRVALSAGLDFARLGSDYIRSTRPVTGKQAHFIDKMPLNFLYLGLIHLALPGAKIIHLRRHPMATCYAIYKTLFTDAYPFSYELEELGRYYAAYQRLMQHWENVLPGVIHHVDYESLVRDFEPSCRSLLDYCELPWEDECLAFHRNRQASTTASASQVREPLYDRSLDQWRHYEEQLQPLRRVLMAEGVNLD